MVSFFEKLKKGMGIEEVPEETEEVEKAEEVITSSPASLQDKSAIKKKPTRRKKILKEAKKVEIKESKPSSPSLATVREVDEGRDEAKLHFSPSKAWETEEKPPEESKFSTEQPEIKREEESVEKMTEEKKEKWFETEGQLAIDVYQTETELVIQSAIAGVKPADLDISMERDIIAIKGSRQKPFEENGDYFTQECYWGSFSREVILPVEVDPNRAEATMKDGILTIRIPKLLREKQRKIKVRIYNE
ncbi:MAG: Hsp20/alpha crystallin family protein [Patescibacteria group bacterium]|nr:Hsp20/alpha crystallin family protein [Patescibacteria group bacterium]